MVNKRALRNELNGLGKLMLSAAYEDAAAKVQAMEELKVITHEQALKVADRLNDWGFGMTMASKEGDLETFKIGWAGRERMIKNICCSFDKLDPKKLMAAAESIMPAEMVPYVADGRADLERLKAEAQKMLLDMVGGGGLPDLPGIGNIKKAIAAVSKHDCENCPPSVRDGCDAPEKLAWAAKKLQSPVAP